MKELMLSIIILFINGNICHALNVGTHEEINEYIARNNIIGFSLDAYLEDNLGINGGITARFNSREVVQLFRDGGHYEDAPPFIPYLRSANHFHNPLKSLDQAGFSGPPSGMSAILWSQSPADTQSPGGYYSWNDVRNYFLAALKLPDPNTRIENFANTFRGLGQLMHLVQDMSVPEHTRNSLHAFGGYEGWIEEAQTSSDLSRRSIFDSALMTPTIPSLTFVNLPSPFGSQAPVPIARLFDSDQYTGGNPNVTMYPTIGLSEYTNANYFSPGTIFSSEFPYPSLMTGVTLTSALYSDPHNPGSEAKRIYYLKSGDGDSGYLLAGVPALIYMAQALNPNETITKQIAELDDNVYSGYAKKLLPRAVGYSAALLSYFFRGSINLKIDQNGAGYVIENKSNETLTGTFRLYYDQLSGNRVYITSWDRTINPNGQSMPVSFMAPTDQYRNDPNSYILVFNGQMGQETNAVIGKVVTDLPLPAPIPEPPLNGYIYGPPRDPGLKWSAVIGAGNYELCIDCSGSIGTPIIVDSTTYPDVTDLSEGTHTWKVRALTYSGTPGSWSALITFMKYNYLSEPSLVKPDNGASVHNPVLDWSPVSGAAYYEVNIYNNNTYTTTSSSFNTAPMGLSNQTWYWKVRAIDSRGVAGNWSEQRSWTQVDMSLSLDGPTYIYSLENATVIACLSPPLANISIIFTVAGQNTTRSTGSNGCATFTFLVPDMDVGAQLDITATQNTMGLSDTITYTFFEEL